MRDWNPVEVRFVEWSRLLRLLPLWWRLGVGLLVLGWPDTLWASIAVRHLPPYFSGTNVLEIIVEVTPDPEVLIYAVQETPPAGWRAAELSEGGVVDGEVLKWGPFVGASPRTLRYRIAPSAGATLGIFHGFVDTGVEAEEIAGTSQLERYVGLATRTLPSTYLPGVSIAVSLIVAPAPESKTWAVEEEIPAGWVPGIISSGGSWDAATRRIKWGVFSTALPRSLTYQVTAPRTERAQGNFTGHVQFGGASVAVLGPSTISVQPHRLARKLPESYTAGEPVIVQIDCQPASYTGSYAIEESPPAGVAVESIDSSGVLDLQTGKIKWGPFSDKTARTLGYRLRPSASARGTLVFAGLGAFDAALLPIGGARAISRLGTATNTECVRSVAATFVPGEPLPIQLLLKVADGVATVAVEERVPTGWAVSSIAGGGLFDSSNGKVKWILNGISNSVDLSYVVTPPARTTSSGEFAGMLQADLVAMEIRGSSRAEVAHPVIQRSLPPFFYPGTAIELSLTIQPTHGIQSYSIEEAVPRGWTVESVDGGGVFDPGQGKLKWGPFSDAQPRQLKALVRPPSISTGVAQFAGLGVFDTDVVETTGPTRLVEGIREVPITARANPDAAQYVVNQSTTLPVTLLLSNDTDEAGGGLTVVQVDSKSLRGADVRLDGASVIYTPSPGFGGLDAFNYRIMNGPGFISESRVLMYPLTDGVIPVEALAVIEAGLTGEIRVRFSAIPGISYGIQGLDDVTTTRWKLLGIKTAGPDGRVEFVDPDAAGRVMRFYQAVPQ